MNLKGRTLVNYISVALLVISLLTMFGGWVTLDDNSAKRSVKNSVEDLQDELDDIDDDDLDDLEDELDRYGISLSPKKMVSTLEIVVSVLKDAAFSPVEMIGIGVAWTGTGEDAIEAIEEGVEDTWYASPILEATDAVSDSFSSFTIMGVLTVLFILVVIIEIVRQITNPGSRSFIFMGAGIVITVYNLILVGGLNKEFDTVAEDILNVDKVFATTFVSFLPLILAIAVAVVQLVLNDILDGTNAGGNMSASAMRTGSFAGSGVPAGNISAGGTASGSQFCPICGSPVSDSAAFCAGCGNRMPRQEAPQMRVCVGCGQVLQEDSVFCPNCGAKNE